MEILETIKRGKTNNNHSQDNSSSVDYPLRTIVLDSMLRRIEGKQLQGSFSAHSALSVMRAMQELEKEHTARGHGTVGCILACCFCFETAAPQNVRFLRGQWCWIN